MTWEKNMVRDSINKRYNVTLRAEITTVDGEPFANETLEYHDMSYEGVTLLEDVWGEFHDQLAKLGPAKLEKHGRGRGHAYGREK